MTLKIAQHLVDVGKAIACVGIRVERICKIYNCLAKVSGCIGWFSQ